MTEHRCPHCRCLPDPTYDMGYVNQAAEFYPLVELCDDAGHRQRRRRTAPTTELGPIERTPFDADAVRARAIDGMYDNRSDTMVLRA